MLEPMPRPAANKPHVFYLRMPVDQKISIPRIFVLADPRLHNRRAAQRRKPLLHKTPRLFRAFRARQARLRIWINALPVSVHCNFQPSALQIRHPINLIFLKQPRRQRRRRKSRIPRRNAKEKHLLPAGKNPRAQNVRKNFPKPSPARKHKRVRLDALAGIRRDCRNRSRASRLRNLRNPILYAKALSCLSHHRHGPTRHQHSTVQLQQPLRDSFQSDLRISFLQLLPAQLHEHTTASRQHLFSLPHSQIVLPPQPQNSRFMKQPLPHRRKKLLPLRQRHHRPSRIQLIRSISHANNPRLPRRTRPRIPRPISIRQHHSSPAPPQMPSRPRSKHPSPNHHHVISRRHVRRILLPLALLCALCELCVKFFSSSSAIFIPMTLSEKTQKDLTDAMRAKDELRLSVLRMVKSAITYKETEKQRKESIEQFTKGNRNDLAEKETKELAIIESYLPAGASDAEMDAAISKAIAETAATSIKQMGAVVKAAKATLEGKTVDGKALSDRVRSRLS